MSDFITAKYTQEEKQDAIKSDADCDGEFKYYQCTRSKGHDGPCIAIDILDDVVATWHQAKAER